jgi:hypothetical protein
VLGVAVYLACSWSMNRTLLLEMASILRGKG